MTKFISGIILVAALFITNKGVNPACAEPLPKEVLSLDNSWWYTPIGDLLYFGGQKNDEDGNIDQIGVWRSNGTVDGTYQISDNVLSRQSFIDIHNQKIEDRVFFVADQDNDGSNELYAADESDKLNYRLEKFDDILFTRSIYLTTVYKDLLFFEGLTRASGSELWKTSGYPGAAVPLKDICPGECSSSVYGLTKFNDFLFFAADNGTQGSELWISDGSNSGTMLFANIYSGSLAKGDFETSSAPANFTVLGDKLLFTANDGLHGREFWVTDGTPEKTELLKDCTPGDNEGDPHDSSPGNVLVHKAKAYFTIFNNSGDTNVWELWETAGTTDSTKKLWTYNWGGNASSEPASMVAMGDKLFMTVSHPSYGVELFVTDLSGTDYSPKLLKDFDPREDEWGTPYSSWPLNLTVVSGSSVSKSDRLYLEANNPAYGYELWVSDGTSEGTVLLKDLNKGTDGSSLDEFYAIGSKLFFRVSSWYLWLVNLGAEDDDGVPDGEDLIKPKLRISSPKADAKVKRRFITKGTAVDNKWISSVQCKYLGLSDWQDAVLGTAKELSNGKTKVSWKCKVKIKARKYKKLCNKGKKVTLKVRGTDLEGNLKLIKRGYSCR